MKKMDAGIVHAGPPFDVQEFVKRISGTSMPREP
jgi:hypothetical protein